MVSDRIPRGYRCAVIAAVGWLALCGADHTDAKTETEQTQTQRATAESLKNISATYDQQAERAKRAENEEKNCGERKYGASADLCAQWKAADAAADSAWWAWASGMLGIGSLCGVLVAIGLAFHANRIARISAQYQLRAYVFPKQVELCRTKNKSKVLNGTIRCEIHNSGQMPASNVSFDISVFTGTFDGVNNEEPEPNDIRFNYSVGAMAPNGSYVEEFDIPDFVSERDLIRAINDGLELHIVGRIEYRDEFGWIRWTDFHYCVSGGFDGIFRAVGYGNTYGQRKDSAFERLISGIKWSLFGA